jgi:hypothetical protein
VDAGEYNGTLSIRLVRREDPAMPTHDHIEQFFEYGHLPARLAYVSKPFCELAKSLIATLPRNPERTVALRKLLEAKDAAVRAAIAVDPT